MNTVIFSPHTDDAVFSIGSYLITSENFTIASAFAGIPNDEVGFKKHSLLRKEHTDVCESIGIKEINGELLDDVYGLQNLETLRSWIKNIIPNFDTVFIPLGIHHPDHILLSNELIKLIDNYDKIFYFYSELPYKNVFKKTYLDRANYIKSKINCEKEYIKLNTYKDYFVKKYKSQVNDVVIANLMTDEEIWRVTK